MDWESRHEAHLNAASPHPAAGRLTAKTENLAGFWRRFAAFFLDSLFVGVVTGAVASGLARPARGAVGLLLSGLYWTLFIGGGGHTLGMRLFGIRAVPSDGRSRVTYVDAALRFVVMVVGEMALFLGFVWAAWNRDRQAWHDLAAHTLVIRERRA